MRYIALFFTLALAILAQCFRSDQHIKAQPVGNFLQLQSGLACGSTGTTFDTAASTTAPGTDNAAGGTWAFTNGNLTATLVVTSGTIGSTTALAPFATGGYYSEMTMGATETADPVVGIFKSGAAIASFVGEDANSFGYAGFNGNLFNAGTPTAYGSTYGASDVIGMAYNATVGALWFSKNGTWQNSATLSEIAAGTTTHAAVSGLTGLWYLGFGMANSTGTGSGILNSGKSAFSFTVPNGYRAGIC